MALVIWTSIDSRLAELQRQCTSLENELSGIQTNYDSLRREHEQKCAEALRQALSGLAKVIKYVNRTDRALIFWVEKGSALKTALRFIGIDQRTQTIVRRKTTIIKARVSEVEASFDRSSQAFKNGLSAVQGLNTKLTQYSLTSIGQAQREVTSFSRELDQKIKEVNRAITKLKVESQDVEAEASKVPSRISAVNSQQQEAQEASNAAGRRSAMGFLFGGAALVTSILCPPVAAAAAGAAAVSAGYAVGNAVGVVGYEIQINTLRQQERELRSKLDNLRSQIADLESEIPRLSQKRDDFSRTKQDTGKLADKCVDLRRESQTILDELIQAREVLSGMIFKTEAIISELSECEYTETRREIASRLNSLVQGLSDIGRRQNITYNSQSMKLISQGMSVLRGRTHKVLRIIDCAR